MARTSEGSSSLSHLGRRRQSHVFLTTCHQGSDQTSKTENAKKQKQAEKVNWRPQRSINKFRLIDKNCLQGELRSFHCNRDYRKFCLRDNSRNKILLFLLNQRFKTSPHKLSLSTQVLSHETQIQTSFCLFSNGNHDF